MGLGEAVFAETLDLLEDPLGEFLVVAAFEHAPDEFLLEVLEPSAPAPGRHGAAQLVRLAGRESRRHHGEFDHLLLEDRHAEGALEHVAHGVVRIGDGLESLAAA